MDNSFLTYLQQLELMAFFSGFPLLYALVQFISESKPVKNSFRGGLIVFLPSTYALVGTLNLGLQLNKLYPDYSVQHITQTVQQPFLCAWAILAVAFWIPVLQKKTVLCLIHSLTFFFFLLKDLYEQTANAVMDKNIIGNDMKIYTISFLLNLVCFVFMLGFSLIYDLYKRKLKSSSSA